MTPTELFQSKHGGRWAAICSGPELIDALLTVNQSLFDEIALLSPEQIASPAGNAILARLQGQLLHERALLELSMLQGTGASDLPASTYPSPEEEAADAELAARAGGETETISHFNVMQLPVESPKPKRKYTKRKKPRKKK